MERDGKGADRQHRQQSGGNELPVAAGQRGTGKEPGGQRHHGGRQPGDDNTAALPVGSIMEIVTMEQPAGNTGEGGGLTAMIRRWTRTWSVSRSGGSAIR